MCSRSKGAQRCRKCGTAPFDGAGHCMRPVHLGPNPTADRTETHGCGVCCRELQIDAERDEYVRLGLPS
ncbi:MAG TPA: hypothetical protein VM683_00330 [Anaeromyxobacteraceae bacterium]|nr:hypothetical protein [Anaeromyxobacteraceae bacterium]